MTARLVVVLGSLLFLGGAPALAVPPRIQGPDSVSGAQVSVSLIGQAKATVIVFLSARCPCSASHEAALRALSQEYLAKGFRFIGVHSNADEALELSRSHFARAALPFPVIEDRGAALADAFGALKTPHAYVVASNGEILFQGGVDDSHIAAAAKEFYLKNALLAVASGRRPDPAEARALGCAIKRP